MPGIRLRLVEREEIGLGLAKGWSERAIARALKRPPSTVSREVSRGGGRAKYRALSSHQRAKRAACRPKVRKLVTRPSLARIVERGLLKKWSPEQIAKRLRRAHPNASHRRVSHETIYQALYLQGRGGLREELHQALRTGRAHRRPFKSASERSKALRMQDMVMISERPAEVADRAVPGHWEGDLIIGRGGHSQVGTLVERTSRFVLLVPLPAGRKAWMVRKAIANKIRHLPAALRRTLTWDQGKEMAEHAKFTIDTGVQVYFCDPHSPWQRGSNENTNGLLRQFLPKKMDFSSLDNKQLSRIADLMNGRPRQTLNWMTPSEKFAEIVAMTA